MSQIRAVTVKMDANQLYEQGFQLRCDGQYGAARMIFEQVLAQNPDHTDSKWQIGLIQGFEGDFDGSLETLHKIVSQNPQHENARYDLAMTMMMLGMADEACAHFHEILRTNPDHEKARQQVVYCS